MFSFFLHCQVGNFDCDDSYYLLICNRRSSAQSLTGILEIKNVRVTKTTFTISLWLVILPNVILHRNCINEFTRSFKNVDVVWGFRIHLV